MALVRTLLSWITGGALLGFLAASLIGPPVLGWYNQPGLGQALCDCGKMTGEITGRMLAMQFEAAIAGALMFLVLGIVWEVRKRKKAPAAAAA